MNTLSPTPTTEHPVAIVGAGPAGLATARALALRGVPYVHLERHTDVGGIWDIDNPGTPMYRSAHFISSRDRSGFFDHPMPKTYADYPTRPQIHAYTRSFAEEFGLREAIRFGVSVESSYQDDTGRWHLQTSDGPLTASALVCCNGVTWDPAIPEVPGEFSGEIRHSVTHRDPGDFAGRRVVVVGLGNSGADIACDAAQNADAAWISTRRGYHVVPKHVLGKPADDTEWMPIWAERLLYALLRPLVIGDVRRWGLPKPDHRLLESHPLLNTQLLHHLQHGDITAKPGLSHCDGDEVVFTDGSRVTADLILFATGYRMSIPYVPREYFTWTHDRPTMFLNTVARRPGLFGVGFLEVNSSAYTLFDYLANIVAQHLADLSTHPERAARFRRLAETETPDLTGGISFIDSDRHATYVEIRALKKYLRRLSKRMDWPPLTPGMFDALRTGPRGDAASPAGVAAPQVIA